MRKSLCQVMLPLMLATAGCVQAPPLPLPASTLAAAPAAPSGTAFVPPAEISHIGSYALITGQVAPAAVIAAGAGNVIAAGAGNVIAAGAGNLTGDRAVFSVDTPSVAGLQVSLLEASGTPVVGVSSTTTDAQGRFSLTGVPTGRVYVVHVGIPNLAVPLLTLTQPDAVSVEADVDLGTTLVATALTSAPKPPAKLDLAAFKAAAKALLHASDLPPLTDKQAVRQRVEKLASDTPAIAPLLDEAAKPPNAPQKDVDAAGPPDATSADAPFTAGADMTPPEQPPRDAAPPTPAPKATPAPKPTPAPKATPAPKLTPAPKATPAPKPKPAPKAMPAPKAPPPPKP
ncbi:MAG TPA: hypothetical protein V6D47_16670 [Oscillatoriaceae cyanobacterium]